VDKADMAYVYNGILFSHRKEGNNGNTKRERCWPRSVCKALRHERKSPESKSCVRTKSRKSEKVVITQTRTGGRALREGAASAKH